MKVYCFAAAVFVPLLASPILLCAQTHLTSAGQLRSSDKTFNITPAAGTVYAGPSVTFSNPGEQLTFSRTSGGFEVDQAGLNYGDTSFINGTQLIGAGGFQGPGDGGLIELDFSTPVSEFGLSTEDFAGTNDATTGSYLNFFVAFDAGNKVIGGYTAPQAGQGSDLSFAGLSTLANDPISYVQFSDTAYGCSNNLVFGNLEYAPAVTIVGAEGPPAPTPEPSSFVPLGSALSALALGSRCLARRASRQ